ncbi:hypothetical protein I302_107138 [Kwoniella bestiolae CBS 10118]|uniref:Uncharacterized protein n=1 Tax=Kwoniella bestiolae CBS 10118 TaxID=1296100 RepID=A0A1B9FZD6_9TREE|nr:hypothetical protein I302_05596 [Kwoniella bestiolae CBS 10118]OCF24138.1 hypothetical protein I302_05596 [Kwoniella bestiolae CBS 10118]
MDSNTPSFPPPSRLRLPPSLLALPALSISSHGSSAENAIPTSAGRLDGRGAASGSGARKSGLGKDKVGWGELPVNVLHLIYTYTIDAPPPSNCLFRTWVSKPQSFEIALAVQQRIWLCRLRRVSQGWRSAVDSHSFWPAYTLLLDPSRPHSSTLEDIYSSRLTPSTPSFPTLFHRARHTTLNICIPCRLNHPSRLGLYPAVPRRLTFTRNFGSTPTCEKHYHHYCSGCLKEYGIESLSPTPPSAGRHLQIPSPVVRSDRGLLVPNSRDIDEEGYYRLRNDLVCKDCRRTTASEEIKRVLMEECPRGGDDSTSNGIIRGWKNDWTRNQYIEEYVEESSHTCTYMVSKAIKLQWLTNHTRYNELWDTAMELQKNEKNLKLKFYNDHYDVNFNTDLNLVARSLESPHERVLRLTKEYELRGEDYTGRTDAQDQVEVLELCKKWTEQAENMLERDEDGFEVWGDDTDEEEEALALERGVLNDKYQRKLEEACINDWLNDRIRFGFWVYPSDEVSKHQAQPNAHTPFKDIAPHAKHPLSNLTRLVDSYDPVAAEEDTVGMMSLLPDGGTDPFLPPQALLQKLDGLFEEKLKAKLSPAIAELVRRTRDWFGDDEAAEEYCRGLRVGDVIGKLDDWELWVPRRLADHLKSLNQLRLSAQIPSVLAPAPATGSRPTSSSFGVMPNPATSPKIELVQEEYRSPTMAEYGIKEIAFTTASDHDHDNPSISAGLGAAVTTPKKVEGDGLEESPKLGKRKSPTEEEEGKIPEKKIRHSPPTLPVTPSERAEDGSPTIKKRKLPPSPETHHIDRSIKDISPPAPLRYDIGRNDMLDVSNGSSLPTTPSPVVGIDPELLKQDDAEEEEEGLFERSGTEISSHDTVGTMPITPDAEEWNEGDTMCSVTKLEEERGMESTKDVVRIIDRTTGQVQVTPVEEEEELTEDEDEYEEEEMSLSSNNETSTTTMVGSIETIMKECLTREERQIPYLPLPPPSPSGRWNFNLNLGDKTHSTIDKLFWEEREVLRRCRCTICERARVREQYQYQYQVRGLFGWAGGWAWN